MSILAQVLEAKRVEVAARRSIAPLQALEVRAADAPPPRDLAAALRRRDRIRVVAEFKRASPSAGPIRAGADPVAIAAEYEAAGAAAISVLTDVRFFDGALGHLTAVRASVGVPVLRKDFLIDAYQVAEARAAGADAVLLIVAALDDATLRALHAEVVRRGMAALVEVHTGEECERALAAGATIIGVNHRDLGTFAIDRTLTARLRPRVPAGTILVGESGIRHAADVRALEEAGADAILVGEALMRQPSPGAALRALLGDAP